MVGRNKIRKQIAFTKELLDAAELQASKEVRTVGNLITIALTEYLERVKESSK